MREIDLGHPDPAHDWESETNERYGLVAIGMLDALPRCTTCNEVRHPITMPGDGWGIAHHHEPHCPEHEDNHPATTVRLIGLAEAVLADYTEEIGSAGESSD